MLPDGVTVRIDARTASEPDALVDCGPRMDPDAVAAPPPVIVVEVPPSGTSCCRASGMDLLVDPRRPCLIHHRRAGAAIETRIVSEGSLSLDPPGILLAVDDLFGAR